MSTQEYSDDDYMSSHHYDFDAHRKHLEGIVACCNEECGWEGAKDECVMCGAIGPLCPECHEVVEPY